MAISSYIFRILAIPCVLEIFTNPLTTFGDAGTLAALRVHRCVLPDHDRGPHVSEEAGRAEAEQCGHRGDRLYCSSPYRRSGASSPSPPFPVRIFPYIFLAWMLVGGSWLYTLNRRKGHIFAEIEADLDTSMQASVRSHDEDMGKVFDVNNNGNRPVPPTFEELELALTGAAVTRHHGHRLFGQQSCSRRFDS